MGELLDLSIPVVHTIRFFNDNSIPLSPVYDADFLLTPPFDGDVLVMSMLPRSRPNLGWSANIVTACYVISTFKIGTTSAHKVTETDVCYASRLVHAHHCLRTRRCFHFHISQTEPCVGLAFCS